MSVDTMIAQRKFISFNKSPIKFKTLAITLLLIFTCLGYIKYISLQDEGNQTLAIISSPKINDVYFLDFRLLSDKLRPKEKYRIAKVVDITGDIITLLYGSFYYQHQNAAKNSIQYGQLRYKDYFEPKRYDFTLDTIIEMNNRQAIYLAKRPVRNKLYGNFVSPEKVQISSGQYIYGKKENLKGEAFLNTLYDENHFKKAFDFFQQSSSLGYAKGQVNLAEMYINGMYVEKDLKQALYWLESASLQSYKPAILKYGIICKQVQHCNVVDFYQNLIASGVNLKVRALDFKLSK